jgi:ribosome-binding ATPase YchF (GTP1/OBG family)
MATVDIAGYCRFGKGASKGEGLDSWKIYYRERNAIIHVLRCLDNS